MAIIRLFFVCFLFFMISNAFFHVNFVKGGKIVEQKHSLLQKIYFGEIDGADREILLPKYLRCKEKASLAYHCFLKKLPEELKKEYEAVFDLYMELFILEQPQTFIDGFSMGVKMMAEVLKE